MKSTKEEEEEEARDQNKLCAGAHSQFSFFLLYEVIYAQNAMIYWLIIIIMNKWDDNFVICSLAFNSFTAFCDKRMAVKSLK